MKSLLLMHVSDVSEMRRMVRKLGSTYAIATLMFCHVLVAFGCASSSTSSPADKTERMLDDAEDMGLRDCRINSDCPVGFYCSSGAVCVYDCREDRDCGANTTCQSGRCAAANPREDTDMVERTETEMRCDQMNACPDTFVCIEGQCRMHCEDSGCPQGDVCDAESGVCQSIDACHDERCPSGLDCQGPTGGCRAAPCMDGDCPSGQQCDGSTGQCRSNPERCSADACPVGTFCDSETGECGVLPRDCSVAACPDGFGCRPMDRRCVRLPENCQQEPCPPGFECMAPRDVCVPPAAFDCLDVGCPAGSLCPMDGGDCIDDPGCLEAGCPAGERCNEVSRTCEAIVGNGALGSVCAGSAECDSGICIDVLVENQRASVCAQLCCSENDCPLGFGCRDSGGLRFCLPSRLYPPNYTFDARAGQRCGIGGGACQSGECDVAQDRCLGVCCTDSDCGAQSCVWTSTTNGQRAFCAIPISFNGRTGAPCSLPLDCVSGVCINAPTDISSGRCADFCCTSRACPAGYICGQTIDNIGGQIVSTCVPSAGGMTPDGDVCMTDDTCASGHCIEGRCRAPCCRDADCVGQSQCRPRRKAQSFVRVCVPPGD